MRMIVLLLIACCSTLPIRAEDDFPYEICGNDIRRPEPTPVVIEMFKQNLAEVTAAKERAAEVDRLIAPVTQPDPSEIDPLAARIASLEPMVRYRIATCYYRQGITQQPEAFKEAKRCYLDFTERYPDHELSDDAICWAAQAAYKSSELQEAYDLLTFLLITYPDDNSYAHRLRDKVKEELSEETPPAQ